MIAVSNERLLPDECLIELGQLVSMWAALENALFLYLAKLSGYDDALSDETPFIIFNHLSFPQRLDILGALCDKLMHRYKNLHNYKQTLSLLRNAQSARNRYIHNNISYNKEQEKYFIATGSARGKVKVSIEETSPQEIKEASKTIKEALRSLHFLVTKQ